VREALEEAFAGSGLALHRFDWSETAGKVGLVRDAAYLVRPDGHVALASESQDPEALKRFIAAHEIRPRTAKDAKLMSAA
jgi:hypothetical protein